MLKVRQLFQIISFRKLETHEQQRAGADGFAVDFDVNQSQKGTESRAEPCPRELPWSRSPWLLSCCKRALAKSDVLGLASRFVEHISMRYPCMPLVGVLWRVRRVQLPMIVGFICTESTEPVQLTYILSVIRKPAMFITMYSLDIWCKFKGWCGRSKFALNSVV